LRDKSPKTLLEAQEWAFEIETNLIVSKLNDCPRKTSDENLIVLEQRFKQMKQAQDTLMNKIDVFDKEYKVYKKDLSNTNTLEYMNWVEGLNPTYDVPSQATFTITREQWELEKAKVANKVKLEILNIMNEEPREKPKVHPTPKLSNKSTNPIVLTFTKMIMTWKEILPLSP
jgi:hypothetical protein